MSKTDGSNKVEDFTSETFFVEVPRMGSHRNFMGGTGYFINNHLMCFYCSAFGGFLKWES